MFEDFVLVDYIITFFFMYVLVRLFALANDPHLLLLKERLASLEAVECVLEEMNGQFYLWFIIPDEGYKFIGQGPSKEDLAELGRKFLVRKYGVSDD